MSVLDLILFIAGLALLVVGAESLVRGAKRLGRLAGLSPLVIGLTIVSFATTAPEASVTIAAASQDRGGLAVGNVLGSNIFNVLVVAGTAAAIIVLPVSRITIRRDIPVLITATLFAYFASLDGRVTVWEGVVMLLGLVAFVSLSVWQSRRDAHATRESRVTWTRRAALLEMGAGLTLVGLGTVLLVYGSQLFVDSASAMASALGVSELVIGLTIVSAGTSAPELTTSLVAAFRKDTDLAIGNAVGASIINLLGLIGLASLVATGGLDVPGDALQLGFPVALAVVIFVLAIVVVDQRAGRTRGMVMLAFYSLYIAALVAISVDERLLRPISLTVLMFILPLSVLVALVTVWRSAGYPVRRLNPPFIDR